ncbi:MAG: SEC-C domain-containing protein [Chitinispirillaceae bacterium]|nr:SEC-C domain-containing protein [Chitinispirillaceae bacterium]
MFGELRQAIAREVAGYLFRMERVEPERRAMPAPVAEEIHGTFDIFSSGSVAREMPPARRQEQVTNRAASGQHTIIKAGPQVGRNDPCPCGSGKKYKKCHGA